MLRTDVRACARRVALPLVFAVHSIVAAAQELDRNADALLAIDQHRSTVVERIVDAWGAKLAQSSALVSIDELRTRLMVLRADRLLAASLAGTLDGVREVLGVESVATKPALQQAKALGDSAGDVVYTPVTPCRLVETRGTFAAVYQGDGSVNHTAIPFVPNEIRSYTVQGGNGVCLTQLPGGLNPSAVQLQVFGIPTTTKSGDIEILPQGASFGSTATMVYIGTIAFNTVSTAARINTANHQISVQVRGGGAHLAIDVVGYFAAPTGTGGKVFLQGGNSFGTTATLGTKDSQALSLVANNQAVATYLPNGMSPNLVSGHPNNGVDASLFGQTIAGGGDPGATCFDPPTGMSGRPCGNRTSGDFATIGGGLANQAREIATVGGGNGNTASGFAATIAGGLDNIASGEGAMIAGGEDNIALGRDSFAAGYHALANADGCFVWGDLSTSNTVNCDDVNRFVVRATNGIFMFTGGDTQHTYTGAVLAPGATAWTVGSDRASKDNLRDVDPQAVLAKVLGLPIATWNWKSQDAAIRHMGPMAQDFHAAFGLGESPKGISTVDADGVALAAIQGLNAKLEERIAGQQREIDELRSTIGELLQSAR